MPLIDDLRQRRIRRHRLIETRRHLRAFPGVETESIDLMDHVGVSGEIIRVIGERKQRKALRVERELEKVGEVAVGCASEAAEGNVGAVDVMVGGNGRVERWIDRSGIERLGEEHFPVGVIVVQPQSIFRVRSLGAEP